MKQMFAITMCLALGASAVAAAANTCPLAPGDGKPAANRGDCSDAGPSNDDDDDDATTRQVCPPAVPIPADEFVCRCFTTPDRIPRCVAITPETCEQMIVSAFANGFLTLDAALYLESAGFCPITVPGFSGVLGFCPRGR